MNFYEKISDYLLDISKLVVGGIILGGIMMEGYSTTKLYVIGGFVLGILLICAFVFFKIGQKQK
jgi:hypothetical protein